MKKLPSPSFASMFGLIAGLLVITILTGCDTVKRYSIQSYQGAAPMSDQRYVENFRNLAN